MEELVKEYEKLKKSEIGFKKTCRQEAEIIQKEIEELETKSSLTENLDEKEKIEKINEHYEASRTKLQNIRLKVAKKNREISVLKRKLDEIPSKSESNQYQKRFIELYNQCKEHNLKSVQYKSYLIFVF